MFAAFLIMECFRLLLFFARLTGQAIAILFLPVRALVLLLVRGIQNYKARKREKSR